MEENRVILDAARFRLTIDRLCYQLIETFDDLRNTCLIGIQPRGVPLSDVLKKRLHEILGHSAFDYGKLDITFYRDDYRTRDKPLAASKTVMDFLVDGKNVVLVDDVLYTGRTVQAAMTALNDFGRPARVELLALVDRRFNRHLPIQADFIGLRVDSLDEAYVKVQWDPAGEEHKILIFPDKNSAFDS